MDGNRSGDVDRQEWLQHFQSNAMLRSIGLDEFRAIMGRMSRAATVARSHLPGVARGP
jgi:hypothetical protein